MLSPRCLVRDFGESQQLHIQAWASALPSDFDRAMREASVSRMATDTDSYAFSVNPNANEGKTAAEINIWQFTSFLFSMERKL